MPAQAKPLAKPEDIYFTYSWKCIIHDILFLVCTYDFKIVGLPTYSTFDG